MKYRCTQNCFQICDVSVGLSIQFQLQMVIGVMCSDLLAENTSRAADCSRRDIQNDSLTPDKELNILIYGMSSYVIIDRSYNIWNVFLRDHRQEIWSIFWPTLYFCGSCGFVLFPHLPYQMCLDIPVVHFCCPLVC